MEGVFAGQDYKCSAICLDVAFPVLREVFVENVTSACECVTCIVNKRNIYTHYCVKINQRTQQDLRITVGWICRLAEMTVMRCM